MTPKEKQKTSFSEKLAAARKAKGLSQRELANLSGVSHRMIAHYETAVKSPNSNVVLKLASVLNVSTDELIGHKPAPKQDSAVNRKTIKKAKMLEELSPKDQKTIIHLIDSMHRNRKE